MASGVLNFPCQRLKILHREKRDVVIAHHVGYRPRKIVVLAFSVSNDDEFGRILGLGRFVEPAALDCKFASRFQGLFRALTKRHRLDQVVRPVLVCVRSLDYDSLRKTDRIWPLKKPLNPDVGEPSFQLRRNSRLSMLLLWLSNQSIEELINHLLGVNDMDSSWRRQTYFAGTQRDKPVY